MATHPEAVQEVVTGVARPGWPRLRDRLVRSAFVRNSFALVSGTVATQAVVFVLSPLLSRIYSVPDFANLANYNAWVAILALVSSLRYEHAIIVARDERSTRRVVGLTAALSLASFVVYGLIAVALHLFYHGGGYLAHLREVALPIPVGVLAICASSSLTQLNVKAGQFRRLATVGVAQALFALVLQIAFGLARLPHGLIFGTIGGVILSAVTLAALTITRDEYRRLLRESTLRRLRLAARQNLDFPRYTLAADGISVVVQQFVPVFVLALFNPVAAGLYAFAIRIVRVPLLVVSTAVSGALRKETIDRHVHPGGLRRLVKLTVLGLLALGVVPFVVVLAAGPDLFAFVFGEKWRQAGELVRVLSPGVLLEFVAFPLSAVFLITNTQRYTFMLQAAGFALLVAALVAGRFAFNDFMATSWLLAVVMLLVNAWTIVLARRVARE